MQIEPVTNAEKNTKPARRMTCCKKWHEKLKKQKVIQKALKIPQAVA